MHTGLLPVRTFCCLLLWGCAVASAQAPIQFNNSKEAIKLYEDGALDSLRERCTPRKSPDLWAREELQAIRNGYVWVNDTMAQPGMYEVFAFDQDKRSFFLLVGQTLEVNARLHLKLALPRDYARCRIVRDGSGAEQLEVLHMERNYPGESQKIQRLLDEMRELVVDAGSSGLPAQCPVRAGAGPRIKDRLLVQGRTVVLPDCGGALQSMRDRLGRVFRKVYDR